MLPLSELLACVDGRLCDDGDVDVPIHGVATLADAAANDISFLANQHYKKALESTKAGVVLVAESAVNELVTSARLIAVADPYVAYARIQQKFYPVRYGQGVRHISAIIDATAEVADDVDIAAGCVISAGCTLASGSVLAAGCVLGEGVVLGEQCVLHAGVTIEAGCILGNRVMVQAGAVIGSDGFGYAWSGQDYVKIPQVGRVVIHDDVEIGANACIDRGALGDTMIQQGVKIDNLVQIGHNVEVGAYSAFASQVGISGSSTIGKGCQLGGQVGVAGHLKVADGCQLAGKAGVIGDIKQAGVYSGFPAIPHRQWLRISALLNKLPDIWKIIKGKK